MLFGRMDKKKKSILQLKVGNLIQMRYSGTDVNGEILAYNHDNGYLIVKGAPSDGKSTGHDVHIVHLDSIEKIVNIIQIEGSIPKPPPVDTVNKSKLEKIRWFKELLMQLPSHGEVVVNPVGVQLFMTLVKTYKTGDVEWDKANIVVLKSVNIAPPYRAENVSGEEEVASNYVKKLVDKFWREKV